MSHQDNVPLLNQQGDAQDEAPDVRFAIDEETGEYSADNTVGGEDEHSSSSQRHNSHKYPPSAPPPSYREATGKSLVTHHVANLCSQVSSPDLTLVRTAASWTWTKVCRYWPTSRFAQVAIFMVGLWVLVIVSGPAFEDPGPHSGGGYPWAGIDQFSETGPGPISGDGHVEAYVNWTLKSCMASEQHHGDVLCTSSTRLDLDIPTDFHTNEGLHILADPPRDNHLMDGRGHIPGTVEFQVVEEGTAPDQSPKGKVRVIVDAHYEQKRSEIFDHATVALLGSAVNPQTSGVGIYVSQTEHTWAFRLKTSLQTYPTPEKYLHRDPPPLYMNIKVLIPAGSVISSFTTETSGMSVGVFTEPEPVSPSLTKSSRSINQRNSARSPSKKLANPYFGRFVVKTGTKSIRTSKELPIEAKGVVKMVSSNGDVIVSSDVHTTEVRLESLTGNIRILEGVQVIAWRESHVKSGTGDIELQPRSLFYSTDIVAQTANGRIFGGEQDHAGVWRTNKTLVLKTSNGNVHAAVDVKKVTNPAFNRGKLIRVEAESTNGNVDLSFVNQDAGTKLHGKANSKIGSVSARMFPSFEGTWQLQGSLGSTVEPPPLTDRRKFVIANKKSDPVSFRAKGTIMSSHPESESEVQVHTSLGKANLAFL